MMRNSEKKTIKASDYYERGLEAVYAGEYEGAIGVFRQACVLAPDLAVARAGLCLAYHEANRSGEIFTAFEELPAHESVDAERFFVMAVALYGAGEHQLARKHIRQSLRLCPNYALSYYVYGRVLMAQRHYVAADRALQHAIELAPALQAARSLRSWISCYLSLEEKIKNWRISQQVRLLHQAPFNLEGVEFRITINSMP